MTDKGIGLTVWRPTKVTANSFFKTALLLSYKATRKALSFYSLFPKRQKSGYLKGAKFERLSHTKILSRSYHGVPCRVPALFVCHKETEALSFTAMLLFNSCIAALGCLLLLICEQHDG